jgi:hypothetical protein
MTKSLLPKTLSTSEAGRRLRRHENTIRRYCENIPGFGIRVLGGTWRVYEARVAEIEQQMLAACGTTGGVAK